MQRVLSNLNPDEGAPFVEVYIDDVLIYSRTLEEHIEHIQMVLECLLEAGLKLKPGKCQKSVEYLGYLITPEGLS